jgi:preprotein translocase subunit SecA
VLVEQQRRSIMERRQALLQGEAVPDVWERAPDRRAALVDRVGEDAVRQAEQTVTLFEIDRAWRDHLALVADLREGIHLVSLGGQSPLARFTSDVMAAFSRLEQTIDEAVLAALDHIRVSADGVDLEALDLKGPSSTWTYLINDDPFRNQIGMMLTGPGKVTFSVYAAMFLMPLLLLWGLVDRFLKRPRSAR